MCLINCSKSITISYLLFILSMKYLKYILVALIWLIWLSFFAEWWWAIIPWFFLIWVAYLLWSKHYWSLLDKYNLTSKKWWIILTALTLLFITRGGSYIEAPLPTDTNIVIENNEGVAEEVISPVEVEMAAEEPKDEPVEVAVEKKEETLWQKNSIIKANSYMKRGWFSEQSLTKQLDYEWFSSEDIVYAIDSIAPDRKEHAIIKANSYMKRGWFSEQSLTKQLDYEW